MATLISEACDRLDSVLPRRASWLHESLLPQVSERDLDILRQAIAPFQVPPELEAMLRWHNGQVERSWWPSLLGHMPLDPALQLARHYQDRRQLALDCNGPELEADPDFPFLPNLLPITWHGRGVFALELDVQVQRAVFNAGLENTDYVVQGPSLASILASVADLAEAGFLDQSHDFDANWSDFYRAAVPVISAAIESDCVTSWVYQEDRWARPARGLGHPYRALSMFDPSQWPRHWRGHLRGEAAKL